MAKTLYEKALATVIHSRFVARADDLGRNLTDDEVRNEAKYQLESIPYAGFEENEEKTAMREMRKLLK